MFRNLSKSLLYVSLVLLSLNNITSAITLPTLSVYYQLSPKVASSLCATSPIPKQLLGYFLNCPDAATAGLSYQFRLSDASGGAGTSYFIGARDPINLVFDLTVNGNSAVIWPVPQSVPATQKWVITGMVTVQNVDYFYLKNSSTQKCLFANLVVASYVPGMGDCPPDATVAAADPYLFAFKPVSVKVAGYIWNTDTNSVVSNTILNDATAKITFKKPDGTAVGDATIDAANGKYSINVPIDTTYTVTVKLPGVATPNNNADLTIQVQGVPLDGTVDSSVTSTKINVAGTGGTGVPPAKIFTWKLQLTWTAIKDLDLYISSNNSCFYYDKKTSLLASFSNADIKNFDAQRANYEEITLLPTTTGKYLVYVKNYSKDGLLKDSGARITIKKSSVGANGAVTNETDEVVNIPTGETDGKKYYWKALTIDASAQTSAKHDQVCFNPTCA
jgi:hypothetical protein